LLILFFIIFLLAIVIGLPVAWALGVSGLIAMPLMDLPLSIVPRKIFMGMNIYVLMCIPFFILTGEIMARGGLTKRLLNFAVLLVGRIKGGLSLANVLASMLFGGITGSAVADASALGSIEIPMMVENGYDADFSAAITSASACIGPIIPPSIPVVIYSMAVGGGVSIGALFAAGIVPGILVGVALMLACYIISKIRDYPRREQRVAIKDLLIGFKDAFLALMTPIIILGGVIGGVFSPTEAGAIAVVYSFIISFFVYHELKLSDLPSLFLRSGRTSAMVMIIIGTSSIFGMVIAYGQVGLKLGEFLKPMGYYGFILSVNIILRIVGGFMDNNPAIIILAPIFAPIAARLGINPIHFGIIFVMNLIIGLITPPLGEVLFVAAPLAGISFEKVTKAVLPFMIIEIGVLLLVSYIPSISLWAPKILGF